MKNTKSQAKSLAFYIIFPNQPGFRHADLRFGRLCAIIK